MELWHIVAGISAGIIAALAVETRRQLLNLRALEQRGRQLDTLQVNQLARGIARQISDPTVRQQVLEDIDAANDMWVSE